MILGWLKMLAMSFVVLTVVYGLVHIYSRSVRRERLEETFDAGGVEGDRDVYIDAGMKAYERGLRKKLIWLVYVIPLGVVTATVWWVNWN